MANLYPDTKPTGSADEQNTLREMQVKAADAGDPVAALMVGSGYIIGWSQGTGRPPLKDPMQAVKYLVQSANSNTLFPGSAATNELLVQERKLGINPNELKPLLYRYMDAGDFGLQGEYVQLCARSHPDDPVCDPVQVLKYGLSKPLGGSTRAFLPSVNPNYLKSLPQAQQEEGARLAAEWRPKAPLLAAPPDFLFPSQLLH